MHPLLLNDMLIIVLLSVVVLYVCQRMHLPIIVGFLLTGVIAGPHGLGLVREVEAVKTLAETGIVLLLFTIGIEFSFRSLLQIRKTVLAGGSLQIGMTTLVGFAAATPSLIAAAPAIAEKISGLPLPRRLKRGWLPSIGGKLPPARITSSSSASA